MKTEKVDLQRQLQKSQHGYRSISIVTEVQRNGGRKTEMVNGNEGRKTEIKENRNKGRNTEMEEGKRRKRKKHVERERNT